MRKVFIFLVLCLGLMSCKLDFWNKDDNKCDRFALQVTVQVKGTDAPVKFAAVRVLFKDLSLLETMTNDSGIAVFPDLLKNPVDNVVQVQIEAIGCGYFKAPDPDDPSMQLIFEQADINGCKYNTLLKVKCAVTPS